MYKFTNGISLDTNRTRHVRLSLCRLDSGCPPRNSTEPLHRHQLRVCPLRACRPAHRPTARPTTTTTHIPYIPPPTNGREPDVTLANEPQVIFHLQVGVSLRSVILLLLLFECPKLALPTATFESPARRQRDRLYEQRYSSSQGNDDSRDGSVHVYLRYAQRF